MDTSKEYIEMCRKAVEVQELWEPNVGDLTDCGLILKIYPGMYYTYKKESGHFFNVPKKENPIYLPRQDQLQDMIGISKMFDFYGLVETFNRFATGKTCVVGSENQNIAHLKQFKSMEQIWLAFVMHAKYSKKWDGSDWI